MMLEAYCVECGEVRVLPEPDSRTCCECDGVLEIHAAWNQEGNSMMNTGVTNG